MTADYEPGNEVDEPPVGNIENRGLEENGEEENTDPTVTPEKLPAHFRNADIHWCWRYGIPAFLIGTLAFLLVADISSGVTAKTRIIAPDGSIFDESTILTVSIVSSVRELWNIGSYALAIFICITSVMWPYMKLVLSLLAWIVPIVKIEKRERFIEIVDSLDKWSFVDIFVLTIIMVSFNSTIKLSNNVALEVVIFPQWGFHAFVAANMMSLIGTQAILYQHRQVQYHGTSKVEIAEEDEPHEQTLQVGEEDQQQEQTPPDQKVTLARQTKTSIPVIVFLLVSCFVLHFVACSVDIYEVSNTRQGVKFTVPYSIFSVGEKIALTGASDDNEFGMRWIQFMYFLFTVVLPPWNTILFSILFMVPMAPARMEKAFFLSEITFSWAAIEVFTLSVIFSILQMPKFGNGLVKSGCPECYQVDSKLLPQFSALCVSTALNVGVNIWLFFRAHKGVFPAH